MRTRSLARSAPLLVAGAHLVPSVAAVRSVRRVILPGLAGASGSDHVALTFDDGPDPASTPCFLDALDRLDVRATFFLLGQQLAAHPALGRRLVADGHEVAVHGWSHRPHLLRSPAGIADDLLRAYACVDEITGQVPRFWRPPHGIATGASLYAARRLGLRPVLWTADGRDWRASATAETVLREVTGRLRAGGVVLLHDADVTSAPGSWRAALGALPDLIGHCAQRGWPVGPLSEHGLKRHGHPPTATVAGSRHSAPGSFTEPSRIN